MKRLVSVLGIVGSALAVTCAFAVPASAARGVFVWSAAAGESSRVIDPVNHYCYQFGGSYAHNETNSVAVLFADGNCSQPVTTVHPGRSHTVPFGSVEFLN